MDNSSRIENEILAGLNSKADKCMSFDEIIEKLLGNPHRHPIEDIPIVALKLDDLERRHIVRRFRAFRGRLQNHYQLVKY